MHKENVLKKQQKMIALKLCFMTLLILAAEYILHIMCVYEYMLHIVCVCCGDTDSANMTLTGSLDFKEATLCILLLHAWSL